MKRTFELTITGDIETEDCSRLEARQLIWDEVAGRIADAVSMPNDYKISVAHKKLELGIDRKTK